MECNRYTIGSLRRWDQALDDSELSQDEWPKDRIPSHRAQISTTAAVGAQSHRRRRLSSEYRGRVREYHYVLKMTSRHFQHVLIFTIDIFSTWCFWRHFQHVVFWRHFQHEQLSLFSTEPSDWSSRLHFQHEAIWLEQFQHGHLWLVGSFVIFSTEHFRWLALIATHHDNTGCIQQQQWYFSNLQ